MVKEDDSDRLKLVETLAQKMSLLWRARISDLLFVLAVCSNHNYSTSLTSVSCSGELQSLRVQGTPELVAASCSEVKVALETLNWCLKQGTVPLTLSLANFRSYQQKTCIQNNKLSEINKEKKKKKKPNPDNLIFNK